MAPGIGGRIGSDHADFIVDEVPAYAFDGEGEHWFVQIRKEGMTTPDAVKAVARAAGIRERDVGVAGMKDKQAITSQWMSFLSVGSTPPDAWELPAPLTLLAATRHRNKLRTGHLRGNGFRVRIYGVASVSQSDLDARVEAMTERGVPNYYGAQRYGYGLKNLEKAWHWLNQQKQGKRAASRFAAKWMPSVIQAELFNRYVALRLPLGLERLLLGEVVRLSGSSRHFEVTDPEAEAPRLQSRDIVLSGPIVGPKMRSASGEARELEVQAMNSLGLDEAALEALGKAAPGSRRDVMMWPEELRAVLIAPGCVELSFSLPSGAYATQVVREFTHCPFGEERLTPSRAVAGESDAS